MDVASPAMLRIAFVPGVTPAKWANRWRERHPDVALTVFQCPVAEQTAVLRDGRAEMSFVRLPVEREGLSVIPLYRELPVVVAPKDHEIALFEEVEVGDLAAENLLQDADLVPAWRDISEDMRNGTRRDLPQVRGVEDELELVGAGAGILILPMSVARLYNRRDVVYRPVTGVAESEIGLAWVADNTDDVIEEFIGIVRGRTERSSRQPSARADGQEPKKGRQQAGEPARKQPNGKQPGGKQQAGKKPARKQHPGSRSTAKSRRPRGGHGR